MKLLTRLRELSIENEINSIDDYRFSMSHYQMRLNQESNNLESNNLKVNHLTQK